jgi:hypothetical protein
MFAGQNGPNDTDCGRALLLYMLFVPIGIADNLTMAYGVKKASALLVWIVSTMSVPLTNILFAFHWVMGEYTTPFTLYNIFGTMCIKSMCLLSGLVAVVSGLLLYGIKPEVGPKQEIESNKIVE